MAKERAPLLRHEYKPTRFETHKLPYQGTLHLEHYVNLENHVAAVVGRWGVSCEKAVTEEQTLAQYGKEHVAVGDTGFKRVWRPQEGLSYEELTEESIAVAGLQMDQTVRDNNWNHADVAAVFIGGDALPLSVNDKKQTALKQRFLEVAGLTHLDTETQVSIKCLACNSGADEFFDAHNPQKHPELQGRPVLVHAQSTLFNETAKYPGVPLPKLMDGFSTQVFSLGAVTIGSVPGETVSLILDPNGMPLAITDEEYDKKGALAARPPFAELLPPMVPGEEVKVRHEIAPNVVIGRMPPPEIESRILDLNAYLTSMLFPRPTAKRAQRYVEEFLRIFPDGEIHELIMHHASYGVGQLVVEKLAKVGIHIPFYWTVDDGNAPPATVLTALARRLPDLSNKNIMIVSFGGGATYTLFGLRLGSGGHDPVIVAGLDA